MLPIVSAWMRESSTPPAPSASRTIRISRSGIFAACGWSAGIWNRRSISFPIASSRVRLLRISATTSSMSHTAKIMPSSTCARFFASRSRCSVRRRITSTRCSIYRSISSRIPSVRG